jgi:hypothetical protein
MKIVSHITNFKELNIGDTFELEGKFFLKIKKENIVAGKNLEVEYNLNAIDLSNNKIASIDDEAIILKRNARIVIE